MSNLKTCRVCHQSKTIDQFHRDKKCTDGHSARCKTCAKEAYALYYSQNSDKVNSSRRARALQKPYARIINGLPVNKHDVDTWTLIKSLAFIAHRSRAPRVTISSILDGARAAYLPIGSLDDRRISPPLV